MLIIESSNFEKQVSIDPISMRETIQQSRSSSPKIKPLPVLPTNYKFLSNSLPSSPRIGGSFKTKDDIQNHTPINKVYNASLARSPLTCVSNARLQKSKSGGENRSHVPYGGSDLWANLNNTSEDKSSKKNGNGNIYNGHNDRTMMSNKVKKPNEMDFKCGALCLFLPGFGKGKPVRARRMEEKEVIRNVISQRVSLEKFECGSWTSSAIHSDDDHTSSTLYFDLPLELIRTSVSDNALPMNSAFVFNKGSSVKGVLKTKTGSMADRKSQEGRHVRFSTSSPTTQPTSPITPRLRKARDDFNAFLEAQSA